MANFGSFRQTFCISQLLGDRSPCSVLAESSEQLFGNTPGWIEPIMDVDFCIL